METNQSEQTQDGPKTAAAPKSDLEIAQDKIQELEAKLKEESNKYLYLYADFDNYKKRMIKERSDTLKFGWENIAREMLGVLDNLQLAVQNIPETTDKNLKTGIEMVLKQFQTTFEKQGVTPVTSKGQIFNPDLHEAMGQEPSDLAAGTITQELTQGFTLHGRLLRPAKVIVSMAKTNP